MRVNSTVLKGTHKNDKENIKSPNILWKSPSLGKQITAIDYPSFHNRLRCVKIQ